MGSATYIHIDTLAEGLTENRSCPRNQICKDSLQLCLYYISIYVKSVVHKGFSAAALTTLPSYTAKKQ